MVIVMPIGWLPGTEIEKKRGGASPPGNAAAGVSKRLGRPEESRTVVDGALRSIEKLDEAWPYTPIAVAVRLLLSRIVKLSSPGEVCL